MRDIAICHLRHACGANSIGLCELQPKCGRLGLHEVPGLFDMALKNLGFLGFLKKPKNLKSPNLGFLENKNLMSDLSF